MLLIASVSSAMIMISFAPLIGVIKDDLGISAGTASLGFMGFHALMTAIACILSGILVDKIGVFKVLNVAMVILIVSNGSLPWLGHGFWPLVIIRAVEAFGCAAPVVAIGSVVSNWFPRSEVGIANGAQSVAMSTGMILGLILAPQLAHASSSWQNGLVWLSLGNCLAFVVVIFVGQASKKYMVVEVAETGKAEIEAAAPSVGLGQFIFTRAFIVGIICIAGGLWTQNAFNDLTPGYLAIEAPVGIGFGAVLAGKLFAIVLGAGIVGSLLGGILMDKVFGGKARPVVLIGFAMIAVCLILLMYPQIYGYRPSLVLCLILTGMGTPFINPIVIGFGTETFPTAVVGKVIGIWMSVALFSQAVGVSLGAVALKATGNYHLSMEIISLVAAIGFIVALFMPKATAETA